MILRSFIKNTCNSRKQGLIFCLLFICFGCFCQDSITYLQNKVVDLYKSKKKLCYTFEQVNYSIAGSLLSRGNIQVYMQGDSVYYRGTHTHDKYKDLKFEIVKNSSHFGYNHYQKNYFENYNLLPDNKRYYALNNSPKDLLKPDSSLKRVFNDPRYYKLLTSAKDLYRLELIDTNKYERKMDGYTTKQIRVYYISKKDYSIVKYSKHYFWTTGDVDNSDSVTYRYSYYNCPANKVRSYVDSFKPLAGKKFIPPPPPKDSITIFPEFYLPDTSGKIKEINSKYVLVDFWYRACAPCIANMKFLDKIKFKDVEVVTINVRDTLNNDIREITSMHSFTFLFNGHDLAKSLKVTSYPTMYLIQGQKILYKHVGYGNNGELIKLLEELTSRGQ